jgi:hypothetical protein
MNHGNQSPSRNGDTGRGVTYLTGNIVEAEKGFGVDPACFLYLPLRVIITEGSDGNAVLGVDVPADLFADVRCQLRYPVVELRSTGSTAAPAQSRPCSAWTHPAARRFRSHNAQICMDQIKGT